MSHQAAHDEVAPAHAPKVYGNLLLCGIPSIADESFLKTILQTKNLGRSLFFGYGSQRMVLVELLDKEEALGMYAALRYQLPSTELISSHSSPSSLPIQKSTAKIRKAYDRYCALHPDGRSHDEIPLAELFLGTPSTLALPYSYLHFIRHRRQVIHVGWSPIEVQQFYESSGVVPVSTQRTVRDETLLMDLDAADTPSEKVGRKRPRPRSIEKGEEEAEEADPTAAPVSADTTSVPPKTVFSKDACQKCGSVDHFTRHCPGVGLSTSTLVSSLAEETSAAPDLSSSPGRVSNETHRSGAPVDPSSTTVPPADEGVSVASPRSKKNKSSDACQYCGSSEHFSRHCPQKP